MNSNLIVLTFENPDDAGNVYESLKKVGQAGALKIDDAAVIVKDESGKVHVKNRMDTGMKWGAVGGGLLGVLLAGVFFPLAGLAVGVVGGALLGKLANLGVDQKFVKDVADELKPGSSALFIMGTAEHPSAVRAALEPYKGTLYQTTLPEDKVEELKDALK